MTNKIHLLDPQTINEIAAGEVIENPSSVVKELVENSIDAGASQIQVEIRGGGRQLIRVIDDGCGMGRDDALACLQRHATSKIGSSQDLFALTTLGFRGEAIPSIAAISKFILHTAEIGASKEGTLLIVEGGELLSHATADRRPGTTIEVKQLFFNVPVRKKFQRSPTWDAQEVVKVWLAQALSHLSISFKLSHNGEQQLFTAPSKERGEPLLRQRLAELLGAEVARHYLMVDGSKGPYRLWGAISPPHHHRPNRSGQYLFINGRAVTHSLFAHFVRESYSTLLPERRYPLFILYLELPTEVLDANVHPQKLQVRLSQEQLLQELVAEALVAKLHGSHQRMLPKDPLTPPPRLAAPLPWEAPPMAKESAKAHFDLSSASPASTESQLPRAAALELGIASASRLPWEISPPSEEPAPSLPFAQAEQAASHRSPQLLFSMQGWLLLDPRSLSQTPWEPYQQESGLLLVDQRRAHERILYERLLRHREQKESLAVQTLLIPKTVELTSWQMELLLEHLAFFESMGFSLHQAAPQLLAIQAYPVLLERVELANWIEKVLEWLASSPSKEPLLATQWAQLLADLASHAALHRQALLDRLEAQQLLDQLALTAQPLYSPRGKPTTLRLTLNDLHKLLHQQQL